jgi:flagellar biosynthesis protein FlhG
MHKTSEWLLSFGSTKRPKIQNLENIQSCVKVSITGGKGGVGKTSIALKTAKELASAGFRTLLIDCDANLSNTAIKLGLPVDNSFEQLLSSERTFEECLIQRGNFHLLSACNGSLALFEERLKLDEIITDIISAHEHSYDYILLDCPAGLQREVLTLNAFCDHRFVVVTPDKSSITDSYSLMKILSQKFGVMENHLILNMYQNEKQLQKITQTLTETVENFLGGSVKVLGGIRKIDVDASGFDTFFLSEDKNEMNRNFVKLLYGFTETASGPARTNNGSVARVAPAIEQDVH